MTEPSYDTDPAEERIVSEALVLPDAQKRRIAVALLKSITEWPDPHTPEFLEQLEHAPREEKRASLEAAIDEGLAELDAGERIEGSPSELLGRIDEQLGMRRTRTL